MVEAACIFCKIIHEEAPANYVHDDGDVVAFRDINPAAPVHVLVVPRSHIVSLDAVTADQWPLVMRCLEVAQQVARKLGITGSGYRVITNNGPDSGQAVAHLHWHVLGGGRLGALTGR